MKLYVKNVVAFILLALVAGCTSMKVANLNAESGYFDAQKKAIVVKNDKVDLDSMKGLLLIPDQDFVKGQLKNIAYFDQLMTFDDLEKAIIKNGLQDKVPSVREKIGISNAAKNYKPFLWFRYDTRGTGTERYGQFILTDPATLEDIFIAEIHLDYVWAGVNDQNTWYPLFNAMIDYIKANSNTYAKKK